MKEKSRPFIITMIESVKNVSKLQARATFLQKCHNEKIILTTMTIKPMKNYY